MANDVGLAYAFRFADGRQERVALEFDRATFLLRTVPATPPSWTELGWHQCDHCPLKAQDSTHCPFALGLAGFVDRFSEFYSYEPVTVAVTSETRTVMAERALQHGLASLIGLVGASSGCPHLAFLRPMARFHLPFATEQETLYRAFSMYLLGCHVRGITGGLEAGMAGLQRHYHAATEVNRGMASRIRASFTKDAAVNAVVVLDMFAQAVPFVIEDGLAELAELFPDWPGTEVGH